MDALEACTFAGSVAGLVATVSLCAPVKEYTIFHDCLASGSANAVASALFNPMDIVKTRMQIEVRTVVAGSQPAGLLRTVHRLYAEGGLRNLILPGFTASMMREMVGGSIRGGMYIPIRHALGGTADGSAAGKAGAALISGMLGGICSNPFEIIKIRFLANGNWYPSAFGALPALVRDEGWPGCVRGMGLSVSRAAVINMGYLASYDHAKHTLLRCFGDTDGPRYHVLASLVSGLAATTVSAPFDMLKTRVMTSTELTPVEALRTLLTVEGPLSLFRGWLPAYLRIGPHALVCFPILEQIRHIIGLDYL
mmetsp:Transcript_87877/g.246802  ORF Transcript_87877/g.246802 Transcript_87877/m.246802 type:complete len:309 (+) Transcript_87877:282-1208(+)